MNVNEEVTNILNNKALTQKKNEPYRIEEIYTLVEEEMERKATEWQKWADEYKNLPSTVQSLEKSISAVVSKKVKDGEIEQHPIEDADNLTTHGKGYQFL